MATNATMSPSSNITSTPSSLTFFWIKKTKRLYHHDSIVGLDIEWRPIYKKNKVGRSPVAILQLCVGYSCLIFQLLYACEIPRSLVKFLNNSNYTFVGVGIDADVKKLLKDYGLTVSNTVDLRSLAAKELNIRELRSSGLRDLAREVLGKKIEKPKSVTLSKWDAAWLTHAQIQYACVDAFVSRKIGTKLFAEN